jgi:hypothetical protein
MFKKTLKYISPINYIKTIINVIKDYRRFLKYSKIIDEIVNNKELVNLKYEKGPFSSIIIGIDLKPELLIYGPENEVKDLEIGHVKNILRVNNSVFAKYGILNLIKIKYDRIKNSDYYGYLVKLSYKFSDINLNNITYIILYTAFISYLLMHKDALVSFITNLIKSYI